MDRDKQIELMKSVEERTAAHASAWINRSPRMRAALHRQNVERRKISEHRVAAG